MTKLNALLNERLKKKELSSKMAAMARQSANGELTSFSGVFNMIELSPAEKEKIENILFEYSVNNNIKPDLETLLSITSEVKAINNQAALLHGERIKKAQGILLNYREGAFSAWMIAAYGNRQTPYNLMQYYEFHQSLPKSLHLQIDAMPRQALYTLASREGSLEKKQAIVENYKGETKMELLNLIRMVFPLNQNDKRRKNEAESIVNSLTKLLNVFKQASLKFNAVEKKEIKILLSHMQKIIV